MGVPGFFNGRFFRTMRKWFHRWISKNRGGFFLTAAAVLALIYFTGVMMTRAEMPELSVLLKRIGFIGMLVLAVWHAAHHNMNSYYDFLTIWKDTDHLPRKQISYVNSFCMTVFLTVMTAGSLALVFLLEPVWQAIRDWFARKPEMTPVPEPVMPLPREKGFDPSKLNQLLGESRSAPEWIRYVWQALEILMLIFLLVCLFFLLRIAARNLRDFLMKPRRFDEDEKIYLKPPRIVPFAGQEPEPGRKKNSGFRYRASAGARIRRHYKRTILAGRKQQNRPAAPPNWASPRELEQSAGIDDRVLHQIYEKARYSREECTEEDLARLSGSR